MARLTIIQKKRRFSVLLPHKILIGRQLIGVMNTPSVYLNIPQGMYEITIQSHFPFIKTSMEVRVEEGMNNVLEFEDKEKYWDILFGVDMVTWIASLFFNLEKPIFHHLPSSF